MASLVESSLDPVRRPILPPELMSLIFDYLMADRDWQHLRPARKLLFFSITLKLRGSLCDTIKRDPDIVKDIKRFEVLDSYPVYDSQWITQQPLTLSNIGGIPSSVIGISARYLYLNNVTTGLYTTQYPESQLCYLNVRTVSLANTESAWELMKAHSQKLKFIKWRCWKARDGVSFPGPLDLGQLPSLKKLAVRLSYGKVGRDLAGFCEVLESATHPSPLAVLELSILFPHHAFPSDYGALRRVTLDLTVHEKVRMWNGRRENSVTVFKKQMRKALGRLFNLSMFHFNFKVHAFNQ
ncbi:hypothetical protein BJ912DRAFT_963553 [Pholiota molesta]|nr:hypothetical protein BJ912DRAFT_963553 [Pholiota molesta]